MDYQSNGPPHRRACPSVGLEAQAPIKFPDLTVHKRIGQQATLHIDQSVNHPDYYALRRYETAQADVSVSVKDKSALGNTFVFIRVQGGKGN